jgi:hypothetical protein
MVDGRYVKTNNESIFNKSRKTFLALLNSRVQENFRSLKGDTLNKDCLSGLDSIPQYGLNDFNIFIFKDEMWFEVHWDLSMACRAVDGTIVSFNLKDMIKYLN